MRIKLIQLSYTNHGLKSQAGLSLVELMVSMVIGLFLLGGVITNFIGTKDSDRMRTAISDMDANARTAISVMRQSIIHAGYPSVNNVRLDKPFFSKRDHPLTNPVCGDNATKRDVSTPAKKQFTKDRSRGDVMTVVALADNPCNAGLASCPSLADANPDALVYYDCIGGGILRDARSVTCSTDPAVGMKDPTEAKIYSTFRLGGGANSRTLYCDGSRGTTQPLVDNIEFMQFLYGVKQDDDTITYIKANDVEKKDLWGLVVSVQIALLIRSSEQNLLKKKSTKIQYTLLDQAVKVKDEDLRRLFRVYTTTINLANQNKGALL